MIHLIMLGVILIAVIGGGMLFIKQMEDESKLFKEYVKSVEREE